MSDQLREYAADVGHISKGEPPNQRTRMAWTHFS
jgi:hypothetical protein